MAELVGGDRGGEDVIQRNLRQQFALQIAHPIALEFLRAGETYDPTSGVVAAEPRAYDSFFPGGAKPSAEVVTFVNEAARKRGAKDFDLGPTVFPVDLPGLDKTVRAEMARVLAPLAEIVHAYDCDVLLLSGRPSRLPGIRALLMELLPLPPERVIALHEYRVGAWYPFRDARLQRRGSQDHGGGRRHDRGPGPVAAAGLLLPLRPAALQEHRQVHRQARRRRPAAAARTWSIATSTSTIASTSCPKSPSSSAARCGSARRQLDLVRWPAARLYALEFARPEYAERHARETPFKIALARVKPKDKDLGDVERFRLRQVTNRDGRAVALDRLTLRLQTLPRREGYWLDTGMLKTRLKSVWTPSISSWPRTANRWPSPPARA